ncbi:hypothetical protein COCNU_10G007910, partial [Cocos nucifera]
AQVDTTLQRVNLEAKALGPAEFRAFMAKLFKDAILVGTILALLWWVPIAVA